MGNYKLRITNYKLTNTPVILSERSESKNLRTIDTHTSRFDQKILRLHFVPLRMTRLEHNKK